MSQLTHRQLPLIPARSRVAVVAAAVAAVIAAVVLALAISASDSSSTVSEVKPGEAPALRSDGGPEESTRGASGGAAVRSDGGPDESTRLR